MQEEQEGQGLDYSLLWTSTHVCCTFIKLAVIVRIKPAVVSVIKPTRTKLC